MLEIVGEPENLGSLADIEILKSDSSCQKPSLHDAPLPRYLLSGVVRYAWPPYAAEDGGG